MQDDDRVTVHLEEPTPSEQLKLDRLVHAQWNGLGINLNNSHLLGHRNSSKHGATSSTLGKLALVFQDKKKKKKILR